jgi:hypothetical protein
MDQLRYKNARTGSFDFIEGGVYYFNIIPYTESRPNNNKAGMTYLYVWPLH